MAKLTAFKTSENDSMQAHLRNLYGYSSPREIICHGVPTDYKFNHKHKLIKNRTFRPFTSASAIKSAITLSIILNAIMLLGYLYNNRDMEVSIEFKVIYMFLSDVVLFYLLYLFNFKIIQVKWKRSSKFWFAIIGSLVIAVALSLIFSECGIHLLPGSPIPVNFQITANIIKNLIVVLIVLLSTLLYSSIFERQQTLLENEKLIVENIRIRYEVLKSQVDPHFLFNSLNTLDGLIGMDKDRAHEYVQNLSHVFRYTIGNKEIMHLNEELDFSESYAHLMRIRYGESIQIQYNIAEKYRSWYIMPISLQLLVENAIKHNVISAKYPLIISIETTPYDTITVSNAIHPKKEAESGEGIGLANLTKRYELLFQKEVLITITDIFCVEIPLIEKLNMPKI